jgi:hypothetical protein
MYVTFTAADKQVAFNALRPLAPSAPGQAPVRSRAVELMARIEAIDPGSDFDSGLNLDEEDCRTLRSALEAYVEDVAERGQTTELAIGRELLGRVYELARPAGDMSPGM